MAMSAAKAAQLSALLECKICMDTYHKPKTLNCGHTYCQDCLDSMLVFNEDGSAELQCSLRCSSKSTLGPQDTTSSLMTTYLVTDILNEFSNVKKVNLQCQQSKECKQIISHSCTTCSLKICDKCQNIHSCSNKSLTNVIFNQKLQELQPLCKQHDSLAKFVCIDCENMFTCVYCTHRQHKNHRIKTIDEFGQEASTWFQSFITSFDDTKVLLESLAKQYDGAFKNIEASREIFVRELEVRKLKRVEEYMERVNAEEKNMLQIFDQGTEDFKTKVIATGFAHNARIHEFFNYVQHFKLKSPFEVVAEKIEIERKLRSLSSSPRILPALNLHLGHLNDQDCLTLPLGKIKISCDDINTLDPCRCSIYKSVIEKTNIPSSYLQLEAELKTLLEKLKENANRRHKEQAQRDLKPQRVPSGAYSYNICENANRRHKEQEQRDLKPQRVPSGAYSYNICGFKEIVKDGDHKKFQSFLIEHPNIAKMRGLNETTLLLEAALHNKPLMVKMLVDAGGDGYVVNQFCRNAYHLSAIGGHHNVLKVLINHDVTKINNVDNCSNTPLHLASNISHIECVKLLLSVPGVDVNIRNKQNKTAYDVARHFHIKQLFRIP